MYKNKKILAIIPARGGSKGVPLKNIHPLLNRPLIGWVAPVIEQVPEIDRAVVSTDSEKIADVARSFGLEVPFYRPENISGDIIGDLDVLTHAMLETEKIAGDRFDVIVMLQPTCPMRKPSHVRDTIINLVENNYDAVWTISESDSKAHPLKQLTASDGNLGYYDIKGKEIIARQQLSKVYHRNGASYAITRNCLLNQKSIMGENPGYVITEQLVSIDTLFDFRLSEFLIKDQQKDQVTEPQNHINHSCND